VAEEKKMTDELEKGPWPSYVKELKRAAKKVRPPRTSSGSRNFPSRTR